MLVAIFLLYCNQGDQIGRIFAHGAIVKFKQLYVKYRRSSNFGRTFFHRKSVVFILTKNGLGYILGDFFYKLIWSP
jgi:hypothetical protein